MQQLIATVEVSLQRFGTLTFVKKVFSERKYVNEKMFCHTRPGYEIFSIKIGTPMTSDTGKQCDHIGRFLKVLDEKVDIKRSPNAWRILGLNLKATLFMLNYFLGNFCQFLGCFLIQHLVILLVSTY